MNTAYRVQSDITCDKRVFVVDRSVKRFFRPIQNRFQRINTSRVIFNFFVGFAVVFAGCRIRIGWIPDNSVKGRLVSTAGN